MSAPSGSSPRLTPELPAPAGARASDSSPSILTAGLVGAALAAIIGVVLAGLTTGIFDPAVISDPGPAIRWSLPLIGVVGELAMAITIGALTAVVFLLPSGTSRKSALLIGGASAVVWTLAALADLVVSFADVMGGQRSDADFGAQLGQFVLQVPMGRILLATIIIAAAVAVLSLGARTPAGAAGVLALVAVALSLRAMSGHTAGAAGHNVALSAMFLHLGGAAIWVGVLLTLSLIRTRGGLRGSEMADVIERFSPMAGWSLVIVAYSGILSAVVRLGTLEGIWSSYGLLIIAKGLLTGVLALVGLAHRRAVIGHLRATNTDSGSRFWRLVAVEIVLMGAVVGVAGALGASRPPVPGEAAVSPTPAQIVTGELLPPEPLWSSWFTQWRWDVLLAFATVAGVIIYLRWSRRLRKRGDTWPWTRDLTWTIGMVLLFWVSSGGPAVYGHILFSAHMVQHMIMAMVIPLFLAMSAPVTLALRALAKRQDDSRGPREWLLILVTSRWGSFFANPLVAGVNFAGSMILFYFTMMFEWSLTTHVGHLAMIAHFSLAGYLFANALIGIDPGPKRPSYPVRLLLLFATMAFHAFFGVVLVTSEVLMVPEWFGLMGRAWGNSAIRDQQIGGSVAWAIGEIPTMLLAVVVAVRWSKDDERDARRRDRRVDKRGNDDELERYNAMLSQLAERDQAN